MAKQRGPVASFYSGRLGNTVGAKLKGGEYVSRSYQPKVKNPNTLRQQVSRGKLALVSALAAMFADPIKIGYSKSAASTRFYARNLFVRDMIPAAGLVSGSVKFDLDKLKLSHAEGIAVEPQISCSYDSEHETIQVVADNAADITLNMGEVLGMVVVATANDGSVAITKTVPAANGVTFVDTEVERLVPTGEDVRVYAYYKIIPKAMNGVPTDQWPWKYPSATSATTLKKVVIS